MQQILDEVDLKDIIREYLDGNFEISNTKMLVMILALKAPEMCMLYLDEILQSDLKIHCVNISYL